MVLPAPVSPVMTVSRGARSRSAAAMTPRFSIRTCSIMTSSSCGAPPPSLDREVELRDEASRERDLGEAREPDRVAAPADRDARSGWHVDTSASVAEQDGIDVAVREDLDLEGRMRADHHRAREERVRRDG